MFIDMELIGELAARLELIALSNSPDHVNWKRIDRSLSARFARQFDTQGGYRSPPGWLPLKPSTIEAKRRAGLSQPQRILYGTGALRNSLARPSDPNHLYEPTDDGVEIGTKIPYAVFHHSKREPRTRLPRRPLLALTRPDQLVLAKMIQADMLSAPGLRGRRR